GITGALLHSSANCLIVPIRNATGALVSTISAPSCTQRWAVFQAMDFSSSAPKIIPFFPFNRLWDIVIYLVKYEKLGKSTSFLLFPQQLCRVLACRLSGICSAEHLRNLPYPILFV